MARAARLLARVLLSCAIAVAGTLLVALLAARTESGRARLLPSLHAAIEAHLDGKLRIAHLGGDLSRTLELSGIELTDRDGHPAAGARRILLRYDLTALLRHRALIEQLTVDGGWLHARRAADGRWNLATLLRPSPAGKTTWSLQIARAVASIDLRCDSRPPLRAALTLDGSALLDGPRSEAQLDRATATTTLPLAATVSAGGRLRAEKTGFTVDAARIEVATDGAELDRVAPSAGLQGPFRATVGASGPRHALALTVALRPPSGTVDARGTLALEGDLPWRATLRAQSIDPGAASALLPRGTVDADLEGEGHGARGLLRLTRFDARALDAHLTATGTSDLAAHGKIDATLQAAQIARFAPFWPPLAGSSGALAAHAHLLREVRDPHPPRDVRDPHLPRDVRDPHPPRDARDPHLPREVLTIDGTVDARHLRRGALRIAHLTGRAHSTGSSTTIHAEARALRIGARPLGDLRADGSDERGALRLHLAARAPGQLAAQIDLRGRARRGTIDASLERVDLALSGRRWRSRAPARLTLGNTLALTGLRLESGRARVAVDLQYRRAHRLLDGEIALRDLDLHPRPAQLPPFRVDGRAHVAGTLAAPTVDAELNAKARGGSLHLQGRVAQWRARGTLAAVAGGATADGRFDLPLRTVGDPPLAVEIATHGLDLPSLRPLLPARLAPLEGPLALTAALSGTLRSPTVEATLIAPHWRPRGTHAPHATRLALAYSDGKLHIDQETTLGGAAGRIDATLDAPLDLARALADPAALLRRTPIVLHAVAAHLDLGSLARAGTPLPRLLTDGSKGVIDLAAEARGTLIDPTVQLTVDGAGLARRGLFDHLDGHVELEWRAGRARAGAHLDLRGARLLDAHGEAALDARRILDGESPRGGALAFDLSVPGFDLTRARTLRPELATVAGSLTVIAHLGGTLAHPTARAQLSATRFQLGGARFSQLAADGEFDGRALRAQVDATQVAGGALHASGTLPVDGAAPWQLHGRADRFDLAFLSGALDVVRAARGRLDLDLTVAGTRRHPLPDGHLRLTDGALHLRDDPHLYDHVTLAARLTAGQLTIDRLTAGSDGGTLVASGKATLDGLTPTRVDLDADARRFSLVIGTHAAWLDAHLGIRATSPTPGHLAGKITVERGALRAPRIESGRKLQSLAPLDHVTFTDARARRERSARAGAVAVAQENPLTVDAQVAIPGPFHVRSREVSLDLSGQLELGLAGRALTLSGHVSSTEGWVELVGRRYVVERARANFTGALDDPALDVRVTRQLQDSTLVIELHGTAKKPELAVRADPPVYDRSQVVGLILSGDPSTQPISDTTFEQKVTGAVSGLLLNKVKDAILPSLPIDVIHLETGSGEGYAGLGQAHLEVGKYLTDNIYVSYSHQFGQTATATISGTAVVNSNQANIEYRFKRRFRLETSFGDAGVGGIDLYWTIRY